jgi:serine protease DegS
MALRNLSKEQARRFGHDDKCVIVMGVKRESPAHKAGIQPHDIILKVGRKAVSTVRDLREAAKEFDPAEGLPLVVLDETGQRAVNLKAEKADDK